MRDSSRLARTANESADGECRRKNVRRKLNAMPMEFADKVVMLVDGEH